MSNIYLTSFISSDSPSVACNSSCEADWSISRIRFRRCCWCAWRVDLLATDPSRRCWCQLPERRRSWSLSAPLHRGVTRDRPHRYGLERQRRLDQYSYLPKHFFWSSSRFWVSSWANLWLVPAAMQSSFTCSLVNSGFRSHRRAWDTPDSASGARTNCLKAHSPQLERHDPYVDRVRVFVVRCQPPPDSRPLGNLHEAKKTVADQHQTHG